MALLPKMPYPKLGSCEYVTLKGERDFVKVIKVTDLQSVLDKPHGPRIMHKSLKSREPPQLWSNKDVRMEGGERDATLLALKMEQGSLGLRCVDGL